MAIFNSYAKLPEGIQTTCILPPERWHHLLGFSYQKILGDDRRWSRWDVVRYNGIWDKIWVWINTYRYSLLGDEHPFTSYFDVHPGYKVLTHCHMYGKYLQQHDMLLFGNGKPRWSLIYGSLKRNIDFKPSSFGIPYFLANPLRLVF